MKYAVYKDRDFIKLLKSNGYVAVRSNGDHTVWFNEERNDRLVVNNNLNPMVARRLIKHHHLI